MSALSDAVGAVLDRVETGRISFTLGAITIDSNSYKGVKTQIDAGKIKVEYKAKAGTNGGIYRYTANTLFLGFQTVDNMDREALIVHECSHAAMDIAAKTVRVSHSEAAAYVAQCLYFYFRNEAAFSSGARTPTFASAILTAAWDVATKARANPKLADDDIAPLLTAIANDSTYKDRHDKDEKFDGVN